MLYQKYRPSNLDEVIGHKSVVVDLRKRLSQKPFAQAIFIEGITGTGKTSLAYILAKTLNCENPKNETPCGVCPQCKDIEDENFTLGTTILNASFLDTDKVRDLTDTIGTYSITSENKVIIIDELQELNNNKKAQKVLLSLLEKKQSAVHFILLSMDASKIPSSIKNRCVSYKLNPVGYEDLGRHLGAICTKEGVEITPDVADILMTIGDNSGGSVRTAMSILEKVIVGGLWTKEKLIEELGISDAEGIQLTLSRIFAGDVDALRVNYTEELLETVKFTLRLYIKGLLGGELNGWEKQQVRGIKSGTPQKAFSVLNALNDLVKFPYLNKGIIETAIMGLLYQCSLDNAIREVEAPKTGPTRLPRNQRS